MQQKVFSKNSFSSQPTKAIDPSNQFGNVELSNYFALAYLSVAVSLTVSQIPMVTLTNWTLCKAYTLSYSW